MKLPKLPKIGRYAACILLLVAIFVAYEVRLFQWQIVDGEMYQEISLSDRTDTIELSAARGQILDRNGEVLAGNRTTYSIVYNALYMDYDQRNVTILQVIDLLEERGEAWRDRLPITIDEAGAYQFVEGREEDIAALKEFLSLADYATAANCMAELIDRYDCGGYSNSDTRNVASVRYSMTQDGYSRTNPYVIASDVSPETVAVFSERSGDWPGIETRVTAQRYYGEDGTLAPHVVGYVAGLTEEQYEQAKEEDNLYDPEDNPSGYKYGGEVAGRSGIESAFEEELRGDRGQETIYTDENGEVTDTAVTLQPQEGNNVQLTLDADLQRVANLSLEKNILGNTDSNNCISGAAVVLDVDTFGVLACSSYPTYDVTQLVESIEGDYSYYNDLVNDEDNQPMFNRALDGSYTPGSVFKPLVALAALQEGVIGASTTYYCSGKWEYYDLTQGCLCGGGTHDLYGAIAQSCNTYFSNVGLNLRIARLGPYAEYFGLGQRTGVEIGEDVGIMSNPEEYRENHGVEWTDGVSAQTAIGQADNKFTPIQLAAYCATMANDGVRLQTHFLDQVTNYEGTQVLEQYQPVELYNAELSSDVVGVVREAMVTCASSGTARSVFGDYPIAIAAKTGTAETSSLPTTDPDYTEPNLSFICYAPAYDPEIAVAVVMEYGNTGDYAKYVAKDILDQYFGYYTWDEEGNKFDQDGNLVDDDGEVLKTAEELAEDESRQEPAGGGETGSQAPEDGDEAQPTPAPSPSRDEGIPDTPFTGEESSAPETGDSSEAPAGEGKPTPSPQPESSTADSPYYRPEEDTGGEPQSSGPDPGAEPGE